MPNIIKLMTPQSHWSLCSFSYTQGMFLPQSFYTGFLCLEHFFFKILLWLAPAFPSSLCLNVSFLRSTLTILEKIGSLWAFIYSEVDNSSLLTTGDFPGGSNIKNLPAMWETWVWSGFDPWVGKIPWRRACHPLQSFCLENLHGQRRLAATIHGVTVRHD